MIKYETRTQEQRTAILGWEHEFLANYQLARLNLLLKAIRPANEFYTTKFAQAPEQLESLEQLVDLPFTFKDELVGDASSEGFAANLTFSPDQYTRFHRTSGTRGRPMIVLDTLEDWKWWIETWQFVLDAADVQKSDRIAMAFSFGPFIGFWSAFDAAVARGAMVAPTGGLTTLSRLELIRSIGATVIFCTPSYALHMAEVAEQNQINVADLKVRSIIVAGEPGGSIPAVCEQINAYWNARVVDHSGASEVGPWGFADPKGRGVYVNESEFHAEFISIENGQPAGEGELSELVLTTLGRVGSPVIRYRTGDLVRPTWNDEQACNFVLLQGGVLGRTDDMMIIRGMNIFPTSVEQILRSFPEIIEYRMTAFSEGQMDQLQIEIEDRLESPGRVQTELQVRLGLRIDVQCVPVGSLPRFEAKGKRFVDKRTSAKPY